MKALNKDMEIYDMVKVSFYRSREFMYDRICEIINQETGLRGKTLHDTISLLANRNDICKPINNRRPTTTIIKNSLKKICSDNDAISRCINALDKLYLYVGVWTFYICPYETFNRVCVSDRDISSCFRPEGSNRRHYEFLLGLNGYAMTQYLYMESETGQIARAIMLYGKDAIFVCNLYGIKITDLNSVAPLLTRAIDMYKRWNGHASYESIYTNMPFYLNEGKGIVIYNASTVTNARHAIDLLRTKTFGSCQHCSMKINIDKAYSIELHGKGLIVCDDCAESLSTKCQSCGERIDNEDVYYLYDESYCESCFHNVAFYCNSCGEAFHLDDAHVGADDNYYCYDCYEDRFTTCNECGCVLWSRSSSCYYDDDGYAYCEECFFDIYCYCEECDALTHRTEAHALEGRSGLYCPECASEIE